MTGVLHDETAREILDTADLERARVRLLMLHRDSLEHYRRRIMELGRSTADTMIVVLNVDEPAGAAFAAKLMPGQDWSAIRARGEIPFAKGLVNRSGLQAALDAGPPQLTGSSAAFLRSLNGAAVLMTDLSMIVVFDVDRLLRGET